jgi:ABC-type oligopeptide transport system ATPase subunit
MKESREALVQVDGLKVHFDIREGFFSSLLSKEKQVVRAVDGVLFFHRERRDPVFGG